MTGVDEVSALTHSIGEHAVQAIGPKHLAELSVVVNGTDLTARVTVALRKNTEAEQRRALEKLFEVQDLFFDDASMTFAFGHDADLPTAQLSEQRQFQFA
ncbi:hypothetical protein [Microbacterium sp. K27]|uniref:hypothetical protein n=1 Tax=Microbacterium sp. K27 TaxID=2305445 RepID=UPI00109BE964|nr:hypothetical protein [Microbacterium sp. K27]